MAKKSEKKQPQAPVTEPAAPEKDKTPVANPAAKVMQLTPIVQPIAFVPYSSQEQPLYMYDEEEPVEEYEDEEIIEEPVVAAPKKKKASAASIVVAILSLLLIAAYCLPYIEALGAYMLPYAGFYSEVSGLEIIMDFVNTLDYTNIVNLTIVAVPVFALLTLIACLIRVCHKGVCVFAKITIFFELAAALVGLIAALVGGEDVTSYYGFYITVGISFISMLVAYLSKND